MEAPPGDANVAPASSSSSLVARLISVSRKFMIVIRSILLCPVSALVTMIVIVWGGRDAFVDETAGKKRDKYKRSLYEKVYLFQLAQSDLSVSTVVTCRLGCVLLLWLVMCALSPQLLWPALKTAKFSGLIYWKWTCLAAFLVLSHPFIYLTLSLYDIVFHQYLVDPRSQLHYYIYYIWKGLLDSLTSLLHVGSVFLVWMLYFHAHEGLNHGFDEYTTRTLVVLLVAALLWLLKCALLLRWEQKAIYEKFRTGILMSAFRLLILLSFFDGEGNIALLPCRFQKFEEKMEIRDYKESSFFSKRNGREYIVSSAHVSLNQIKHAAEILTILTKISTPRSTEDAHQFSAILEAYEQKIATTFSNSNEATTKAIIRKRLSGSTVILLEDVLRAEYPSKDLNQVPFDEWVVDAHKSCLGLAYTLTDAFATVRELDMILTSCLVMAVIVVWLIVTELASTTVLVVIASPFLALSFVFGDVCKNFFHGFIFAFITHPFDIGDRCIINEVEVEVKRVNTMTTTCMKIGTNEQMLYPNSNLAANLIINLGDKLDPNDVLEIVLHPSTKMKDVLDMKKHIDNFIDSDKQRMLFKKEHKVVVKELNNGIKIIVYFQHTMNGKDLNFSEFLEKKEGQRSILYVEIKKFLEKLGVEIATS